MLIIRFSFEIQLANILVCVCVCLGGGGRGLYDHLMGMRIFTLIINKMFI